MAPHEEHRWIVDAVEEGVARVELEEGDTVTLPAWLLPSAAAAGDVLRARVTTDADRATLVLERDAESTRAALARSAEQLAAQPVAESRGDIEL